MKGSLNQQALVDFILPFMTPYDTGQKDANGLTRYRCPHTEHNTDPGDYRIWIDEQGMAASYCYACQKGGIKLLYEGLGQEFPPECAKKHGDSKFEIKCTYPYKDSQGNLLAELAVIDVGKSKPIKRYRHYDPTDPKAEKDGWVWSLRRSDGSKIELPLFNKQELFKQSDKCGLLLYAEGEKDAVTLISLGFLATTHPFGVGAFKTKYIKMLKLFDVVFIQDNDEPGLIGFLRAATECHQKVKSVKLCEPLGKEKGYDVTDWVNDQRKKGLSDEDIKTALLEIINNTQYFDPKNYPDVPEPSTRKRGKGKTFDISVDPRYTEEGLAQRLVEKHGNKIRFCGDFGSNGTWFYFDETRWNPDCESQVNELIIDTVKSVLTDIPETHLKTEQDQKNFEWLQKFKKNNLNANKIRGIKFCAQGKIIVRKEKFNRKETTQWILNTLNGMIDLKAEVINLIPPDPDLFITQVTPVEYVFNSKAPHFMKFILELSDNRPELVDFIQQALGLALIGNNQYKVGIFFKGEGDTGKTTLLEIIMHTLGFDYSHKFNISLICESPYSKSEQVTPELAALHWKRFAVTSEGKKKQKLDVGKFKEMTGGNTQLVNPKYKDPFLSKPSFTMYIDTNEIPDMENPDQATRNRIVIIPCDHIVIKGQDMDENLFDKLIEEREGILAWLVEGCRKALKDGLNPPSCVKNILKQYWEKTDKYTAWLYDRDYIEPDKDAVVTTSPAYECFKTWCNDNDIEPPSRNTFRKDMNEIVRYIDSIQIQSIKKIKGTKSAGWMGFRLKDSQMNLQGDDLKHDSENDSELAEELFGEYDIEDCPENNFI